METIEKELSEQEKQREKVYEENTTPEERAIYWTLLKILEHFRDNIFPDQYEIIKMKKLYNKEYERKLREANMKHKSAKIYPLIQSIHDTFMASLYDNDLKPKIYPIDKVDPEVVDNAEKFFQWWVEVAEAESAQEIVRNEATLIWRSYAMPGYTVSSAEIDGETKSVFIPALYPVSFFEMFYSVWATDFYKAPEKFRRRFIAFSQLKDSYYPIWDWKDWMGKQVEKKKNWILNYWKPLSKADYTKIYDIEAYSKVFLNALWDWDATGLAYDTAFNVLDSSSYCEVIELYIWSQLMVFVNWYVVYSWQSPFYYWEDSLAGKDWPFIELTYEKWNGSQPRWIWHKIMWHQKQCNSLYNSLCDAIYRHLNPSYTAVRWAIIDPTSGNAPTVLWDDSGKVYEVNPSYTWANILWKIDFTDYNMVSLAKAYLEDLKNDAYTICWVNSYVLWWEGKVERSRYWAESRIAWSKARLAPITKSIWRFYSRLFYHWLWLAKNANADVAYISDDEWEYEISLSELDKKFKIICSADNSIEETKASKVQWLLTMMQNTAQFSANPITWLPDINNQSFLESVADYAWLRWFKTMSIDEQKEYIDESYEIKNYIQEKEMESQQKAQASQPQQSQQQMAPQDQMMAMQWQQPVQQMPEEQLDYTF